MAATQSRKRSGAITRRDKRKPKQKASSTSTSTHPGSWTIAAMDPNAFKRLPYKIPHKSKIPPFARGNPNPNRYADILPTMKSRVELSQVGGTMESTYINANWVTGSPAWNSRYIASQGPTSGTVPSFVRMVWETKAESIVMTTNLVEKGKAKCARYWPELGEDRRYTFGEWGGLQVSSIEEEREAHSLRTVLRFSHGKETRVIVHHWYDTWPDHGVPRTAGGDFLCEPLLALAADVRETMDTTTGPIIVHCSAGIGRTGTFIGVDVCSEILRTVGTVDIVKVVDKLRDDRGGLVQHDAQLKFLHAAVTEYAESFGHNEVNEIVIDLAKGTISVDNCTVAIGSLAESGSATFRMTFDEFHAQGISRELFNAIDLDHSGTVSASEFRAFVAEQAHMKSVRLSAGGTDGTPTPGWIDQLLRPKVDVVGILYISGTAFRFTDLDGDGEMSLQEAKTQGMTEELFSRMDANGDGSIQVSEFRKFVTDHAEKMRAVAKGAAGARATKITAMDRIGSGSTEDGELSMGFLSAEANDESNYMEMDFLDLDLDGDGELNMFEAAMQGLPPVIFKEMDRDRSGTITGDEFKLYTTKRKEGTSAEEMIGSSWNPFGEPPPSVALAPSLAGYSNAAETLVPMETLPVLTLHDIGKRCEVRKFPGVPATLAWVGMHASKRLPRCGVVLGSPDGFNDGCLRPAGASPPFDRYFKCDPKCGVIASPAHVTLLE